MPLRESIIAPAKTLLEQLHAATGRRAHLRLEIDPGLFDALTAELADGGGAICQPRIIFVAVMPFG